MSQQGPIVAVLDDESTPLTDAIGDAKLFPLIESNWRDAAQAISRVQPAAVIALDSGRGDDRLVRLASQIERMRPYTALIVLDPTSSLPPNAIPFTRINRDPLRLSARLRAALRVRTLHATVLRRMQEKDQQRLRASDPLDDANALLIGRGALYPSLSVALGERVGVIGAFSIEAAAKHLNARDIDGIVIGDGFTPRVIDAFLTVLSEDSRFRHMPVILTGDGPAQNYDLPNLEWMSGAPFDIAANAIPLIRQNAFEARLNRTLKSIEAGGLLDPRTGLLTQEAFREDFTRATADTLERGADLSVARFALPNTDERAQFDAARIISRLMRRMDFATLNGDDSILIAFAETDMRNARMIARRLASILRQTVISDKNDSKLDPDVSVATLMPDDSAEAILNRLDKNAQREAS